MRVGKIHFRFKNAFASRFLGSIYIYIYGNDQSDRKISTFFFHESLIVHNEDMILFMVHSTHIELIIYYSFDYISNTKSI